MRRHGLFPELFFDQTLKNGLAPIYLSELLCYSNSPRLLRSSSQNFLAVPRSRLMTYDDRAFSVVALKLWNQLPPKLNGVSICRPVQDTFEDILI